MNNYEHIKQMSIEEMAAMLYIFLKPFMDGFEIGEEQKKQMRASIMAFLTAEPSKKK